MDIKTWKDLKEFANSLDEKQLEKKVVVWREEEAISDFEAITLEADHYIGDNDDGCYSLSDAGLTIEEAQKEGLEIAYPKGHPIIFENF
ncbi:hypothetical protein [Mesonia aestuariivivens]|uniref:Uncharacterized protein n=1 Tax=Mesonia aestuariivivens TaxID=2796128 RepID=A0ABS6W0E9_9FLAO|nr:hypothetical protein [Mesonia aestuariivivens]MBW2961297.1 hypothetical protein [Mesonia aestuariivivens]